MSARGGATTAWAATVVAFALAALVDLVVRFEVVHGSLPRAGSGGSLVAATAGLLALATAAACGVLARAPFSWHADGLACLALLVALTGALLAGWEAAPDQLRAAGSVAAPLTVPLLLALVEPRARGTTRWTASAAAVVGVVSFARFLVRDPFADPDCWVDCSLRGVALLPSAGASQLAEVGLALTLSAVAAVVLGLTVLMAVRRERESGGRRRSGWQLDIAVVACATVAAVGWAATAWPSDRQTTTQLVTIALTAQCAAAILVVAQPILALRRRQQLRTLAAALGELPPLGTLEATLGRLLGDGNLRVAFWLPASHRYVDAAGDPVDVDARPSVTLSRAGQPLARVFVTDADRDTRELEELIGSAARLAIDSERLQAEVRAQLVDLTAARQRIVAAADNTRRQVERTIHDEVQSELVGALMELTSARSQAEPRGTGSAHTAAALAVEIREMVAELREFARGVYPAVLDAKGLPAALDALADRAPVPLRIDCLGDPAASAPAQRAAYLVVHDAVVQATEGLEIRVDTNPPLMALTILGHSGTVREDIADRVGALGGTLTLDAGVLRAVLPCG